MQSRLGVSSRSRATLAGSLLLMISLGAAAFPQSVNVGAEAPDFSLSSLDGETYRLQDLRGDSVAVLVFFRGAW